MNVDLHTQNIPFCSFLGIEAYINAEGQTVIAVELRPDLMNSHQAAHGGVIMSLLDVAMTRAAAMSSGHKGAGVTSDFSVQFLSQAKGRIVAVGKVLRSGRSLIFCEAEARDVLGQLVAKSHGTIFLIR